MTQPGWSKRWLVMAAIVATVVATCWGGLAKAGTTTTNEVNVRDFGAVGDGVANDTAAIQKAMDTVAAQGGGRVFVPDGVYLAAGLQQGSYVELFGGRGAVLKHLNGVSPRSIVSARRTTVTGSIMAGSKMLRLNGAVKIQPGAVIAVRGAAGAAPVRYLYGRAVSISTSTVTLDTPALLGASNATVSIGSIRTSIRGLTLDGNRFASTSAGNTYAVEYQLARWATVADTYIRGAEHGGVSLDLGTVDSLIENNVMMDNGNPLDSAGSAVWVFRGASRNVLRGNTIGGQSYRGIFVDDQTATSSEWDASSNDNVIENNSVDIAPVDWNSGIYVAGSSRNTVKNNIVKSVPLGIAVNASGQGAQRNSEYNVVTGNVLDGHRTGIEVTGSNNTVSANQVTATTRPYLNSGTNNRFS